MKASRLILCTFFVCSLFLFSCTGERKNSPATAVVVSDSAHYYFNLAKETEDIRELLQNLTFALNQVEDQHDTLIPDLLDYKIYYHNRLKEFDSSLLFTDSLIKVATSQKDTGYLGRAYYRKAKIYDYLNDQELAFKNSFESRRHYISLNDSSAIGRRTLEMALAQNGMTDYVGSQENATEALQYLNEEKDSAYIGSVHGLIGITYREQGFLDDAIAEHQHAMRYSVSREDSLSDLNNIALIYRDKEEYSKAIDLFKKILKKTDTGDLPSRAVYLDNLAFTRWLQDSSAQVEDDLNQALEMRLKNHTNEGLLASYGHLAKYYRQKNPKRAEAYAFKLLETAKKKGSASSQLHALEQLISLAPADEVQEYSIRFIELNDSVNKAGLQAKNTFAKIKFDEEQKNQEIQNLEAISASQELHAQRLQNRNLMISMGAILGIIATGFLIFYLRQRSKKEKLQEVYKTENRISKKIHDELANDLYNVMTVLEPVAPEQSLDNLEKIYQLTRDISRENREIPTGENFGESLVAMLSSNSGLAKLILRGEKTVNWKKFSEEKKITIYRVLQELMINMKKHSGAKLVALSFKVEAKNLEIKYSDTGRGTTKKVLKNGNGLQNVENRIFSVNGSITFETDKGKGFRVNILLPY